MESLNSTEGRAAAKGREDARDRRIRDGPTWQRKGTEDVIVGGRGEKE